jgi:hypothetical protein
VTDLASDPEVGAGDGSLPPLGRYVSFRPVLPFDYDWLYALACSPEIGWRWRFRGTHPSPDAFAGALWDGVLCQFIVDDRREGASLGLVTAHDASHRHGYAYVSAVFHQQDPPAPWQVEGLVLFVQHLFRLFPFRKLYLQTNDLTVGGFGSLIGSLLVEEGRLRDHEFHDGRYVDQITLAIARERWLHDSRVARVVGARHHR